ncbi:MAG TPA: hypothetical protein PLX69_18330 [Leptospiraceae bacterium]|nr:hypothetical protein [Leptospiraceae bacterium]
MLNIIFKSKGKGFSESLLEDMLIGYSKLVDERLRLVIRYQLFHRGE